MKKSSFLLLLGLVVWLPVFGEEPYKLKANDQIELTVFQEQDLSKKVKLTQNGEATFSLIGTQKLSGLSLAEATELIRKAYATSYLVNPNVTLNLLNSATETVTGSQPCDGVPKWHFSFMTTCYADTAHLLQTVHWLFAQVSNV